MTKQCIICKHDNSDTAIFCETCSSPFEASAEVLEINFGELEGFSLTKGELIAGHYQIVREISRGVLGILYQIKDTERDNQIYYLKILHPRWSSDPEAKKRFMDEISICIDPVNPPQIQTGHLENGQDICFYITGPSLRQYLVERKDIVPPFSLNEIRTVILALLDILDYTHQYTVHNKISPEAIIVLGSFPDVSIRLLDFSVLNENISVSHDFTESPEPGSLLYMAPEQVKEPLATDPRADLYSVGVILYEMLTGQEAVGAFEMPSDFFSAVYLPLDKVIKKVLSPKVNLRYSTALEFSTAISSALTEIETSQENPAPEVNRNSSDENKALTAEQQHTHTRSTNELPEKIGRLHGSRIFLVAFVAGLLFLGGGAFVLLNKDRPVANIQASTVASDRPGSVNPIDPTDSRKKTQKTNLIGQKQSIIQSPETDEPLPVPLSPELNTGHLTISPVPLEAKIRILNIRPPYKANMELNPGRYEVEVSAPDYNPLTRWIDLSAEDNLDIEITLNKKEVKIPEITTGHLTISAVPPDALIRILNIKQPYEPNIELASGRYQVEVSAPGHDLLTRWVELSAKDNLNIELELIKEVKEVEQAKEEKNIFVEATTGMEFKYIAGGCYSIGQSTTEKAELIKSRGAEKYQKAYSDETPQHEVCVDGFYMGKYEVTVRQWSTFIQETGYKTDAEKNAGSKNGCYSLKSNKWSYTKGRFWNNLGFPQSADSPVACVSYDDVNQYINWLNKKGSKQYNLPTEAEWEYAARGGTRSSRFWGDAVDKTACLYANVAYSKKGTNNYFLCDDRQKWSSPVGSFKANNYGMYDMLGNMWEWCADKYDSQYYSKSPRNNPPGASSGQLYTIRGGSWNGRSSDIRAANRNWAEHDTRKSNVGFRLVVFDTSDNDN